MGRPRSSKQLHAVLAGVPSTRPLGIHELDDHGVTSADRRLLVAAGLLRRPLRGVYCHRDLPDSLEQRVAALQLVVPDDCVITDRSAGWLQGATMTLAPGDHLVVPPISVFAPPGRRLRNDLTRSGERHLDPSDVTQIGGLQVTTPLRTACDLGRLLHRDQALGAMDQLARVGSLGAERIVVELDRFKGYRGVVQARELANYVDPRAESPGESLMRLRWLDAGLPTPECQVEIEAPNGSYFLDVGLPEERFGAEYDGADFHGPEQQAHDDARRDWARSHGGWHLLVARNEDVTGRRQTFEIQVRNDWHHHRRLTRLP